MERNRPAEAYQEGIKLEHKSWEDNAGTFSGALAAVFRVFGPPLTCLVVHVRIEKEQYKRAMCSPSLAALSC